MRSAVTSLKNWVLNDKDAQIVSADAEAASVFGSLATLLSLRQRLIHLAGLSRRRGSAILRPIRHPFRRKAPLPLVDRLKQLLCDARVVVPLLLSFVIAVTGPNVFRAELWGDELRTWRDGIEKPLELVLTWKHNPDHSPLGHLSARAGAALFGVEHPWALRMGNWICGLLCVPALWWMGRTLASGGVGLLAAAMFSVDPNSMLQITQARMYGFLMLAGIVAFTLAGSILLRPDRPWRRVVGLGFAIAVGIWAHSQIYSIVISILLLAIGLLWSERRAAVALLVSIVIAGAIGFQGVAKIVSRHDAEKIENAEPMPAGEQLMEAIRKLGGKEWITVVLIVSAGGGATVLYRRGQRSLAMLIGLIVGVSIINLAVAARYRPVAHARYLTILQPAMWLAMSVFMAEVCRPRRRDTSAESQLVPSTSKIGALFEPLPGRSLSPFAIASIGLLIGLSVFEFTRVLNALELPPRARGFALAAREIAASRSPADRVVVVSRSPYAMYARYYELRADEAIDTALEERASVRKARDAWRAAKIDQEVIWIIGVVQPAMKPPHASDDPMQVAARIAEARGIAHDLKPLDVKNESKRVMLVRIDEESVRVKEMAD